MTRGRSFLQDPVHFRLVYKLIVPLLHAKLFLDVLLPGGLAQRSAVAVEKAAEHSLAAVAAQNCYHVGRIGVYLLAAVERGFIGQAFCNGHGICRVAPWGGTDSRLATNPVAFAFPTRGDPILVDFATSTVAEGKVRLARALGRAIPEGWVMDEEGEPTTDPEVLYSGGALQPLGGRVVNSRKQSQTAL